MKMMMTAEQKEEILKLARGGLPIVEIGKRLGVESRRVGGYIRTMINSGRMQETLKTLATVPRESKGKHFSKYKGKKVEYRGLLMRRLSDLEKALRMTRKMVPGRDPQALRYFRDALLMLKKLTEDSIDLAQRWSVQQGWAGRD